jgi:RHS repeat-associated protein
MRLSSVSVESVLPIETMTRQLRTYLDLWRSGVFLFVMLVLFFFPTSNQAQTIQYTQGKPDQALRSPMRIDPATLGLSIEVPIANYPGRASAPINLIYSSKQWRFNFYDSFSSPTGSPRTISHPKFSEWAKAGWTTSADFPIIDWDGHDQKYNSGDGFPCDDCPAGATYINRIHVHMPGGASHELRIDDTPTSAPVYAGTYFAVDGSRLRYEASSFSEGTLYLPDGAQYWFRPSSSGYLYIDPNGNTLSYNMTTRKWTDTQNRVLDLPLPASPSATTYNYNLPSPTGTLSYSVRWSTLQNALTNLNDPLRYYSNMTGAYSESWTTRSPALFDGDGGNRLYDPLGAQGTFFNPMVLAEIVLPNGQHYLFTYNVWGEITKVVYPTGGYERFDHAIVPAVGFLQWPYTEANRGVVDRWLSPTGNSSDEQHWHYAAAASSSRLTISTTAPDNSLTERVMIAETTDGSSNFGFNFAELGMELEERTFASTGGAMLARKLTKWAHSGSSATRNPRAVKQVNILFDPGNSNALTATTTMFYDDDVNVIATNQYDFTAISQSSAQTLSIDSISAPPLPLRTEEATYLVNDTTLNASTRAAYRARNLVGLLTSTRVKNSSGTELAKTKTSYDDFDDTGSYQQGLYPLLNYGVSIGGWIDVGSLRGLATTSSVWLDTTAGYVSTHAQFDQFGNLRNTWDANGKQGQMSYSANFSYAYLTSASTAVPDPTGTYGATTGLSTIADYNANTGLMTVLTDANGRSTSYEYDSLNRLSVITLPDGGHVTYGYFDQPGDLYIRVLTEEDASRSIETRTYADGLGRPTRSFLNEGTGSTPWLVRDTYYDNMGRLSKTSNPYRVAGANSVVPTTCAACTTTGYDALGRVLTVTTPDSAQGATSYGASTSGTLGAITTVTDQALRKRRSLTDVLGRVVRVDEPNKDTGSLDVGGVSTVYVYNLLGSLLRVDQDSQRRFFSYDSLGRLVRAKSPEQNSFTADSAAGFPALTDASSGVSNDQWSVGYIYDANGNLLKRRDARNVMTTYAYDALNRMITVRYTDGTKDIDRHYDNPTANKNGLGRFWYSNYEENHNTRFDSHLAIDQYDTLGRPLNYRQHFFTNGVASPQFNISRTYDRAGHVLTQTYPSGHTVTYGYDVAGRLISDSGNLGDGVSRTYATSIAYSEFGGMQEEQFGTQTALYHKQHYNIRGQLYDLRLSTASWTADEWNWNRGAIVNYNSTADLTCQGQTCRYNSGPDNNGNLRQSQYWIPGNDQMTTYNWTEDRYSYDYINRLKSVAEYHGSSATGLGGQDFTQVNNYDRWGNRTIDQGLTTPGIPHPNYSADPNTNRLVAPIGYSYSYDNGGNLTNDNYTGQGSRTYDAENRMLQAQGLPSSQWQTYTYDADGRRIKRNVNGVETWQVYGMEGELLADYRAGAAAFLPVTEYGYRGGQLLVTIASGDAQRLSRFVYNLYYGALQRDPTSQELTDTVNQLAAAGAQSQSQLLTVASQITRSLFTATNYETSPYRSDAQYVTDLYYVYLQRAPDDGGLGWWTPQAAGSRVNVCNAFEASGEFQTLVATLYGTAVSDDQRTEHFINNFYLGARGTSATSAELQQQRDALNAAAAQGVSQVQTQAEIFGRSLFAGQVNDSSISNTQYVANLYEAFLQRGPDAGGLGWWSSQASVGQGRQNVLNAFAACDPFRELAGALYREANWLVADHLGTPRMVINKIGSLASVKRHDYLPFGEEIGGPLVGLVGGRTTEQGYSADSVRLKFNSKERDGETGLDYFGERYYGCSIGRFTTPDPMTASASIGNPQSFNRFTFVLNNPLRYVDPEGLKEASAWDMLSREEQRIIAPKIITRKGQTVAQAFNKMATVRDAKGNVNRQATADKVTTIKNFIDSAGGHANSAVWREIKTINRVDLQANPTDPSRIEGRVQVDVKNYENFTQALGQNGYWVNSDYEIFSDHPNDSARQETRTSFEPGIHFSNDDSNNLNRFFVHWDKRSSAFRESSSKYWTSWGEMKEAAETHTNPYTPNQLRHELRKNGTVPRGER